MDTESWGNDYEGHVASSYLCILVWWHELTMTGISA